MTSHPEPMMMLCPSCKHRPTINYTAIPEGFQPHEIPPIGIVYRGKCPTCDNHNQDIWQGLDIPLGVAYIAKRWNDFARDLEDHLAGVKHRARAKFEDPRGWA